MNKVELHKSGGFYLVFGDGAFVMHYFFGYKINEGKVGFPLGTYDKVISKLDELNINYCVPSMDVDVNFGRKNRYNEFVNKGKKKFDINYRIDNIVQKLALLSEEDLDSVIDFIDGVVSKYEG